MAKSKKYLLFFCLTQMIQFCQIKVVVVSLIFLDVSCLSFSFLQVMMKLKMRHLNKIRETNGGKIKEQDVPLT